MEKIKKLKKIFIRENIDGYIIPKNDEFFGEYIAEGNDRMNYLTNFSGSYGFSLLLKNKNLLFVDGRYTLQAIAQSGKKFKIITFPKKKPSDLIKNKKLTIGFDPKLFTKRMLNFLFNKKNTKFKPLNNNLVDEIWKRKINTKYNYFYSLPEHSIGDSYKIKIKKVIDNLKKKGADFQFITASENNAWLLNIRGEDAKYSPLPNCYILIDKQGNIKFFCNLKKVSKQLKKRFKNIKFIEINQTEEILAKTRKKKFIVDRNTCSYYFENIILLNNIISSFDDPIYYFKAIKSRKEINNIKKIHIFDGVALTKYLFWLKRNYYKKRITEISASSKLYEFRKKNKKFKSLSFPTISGTGPNGAIIHYKANKKTNRVLKLGDIYLVDSGGQYEYGTTDVTRTISLKNSNKRIKKIFTRVLKGHIAVSDFRFKKNTSGSEIDIKARKYLKQIGLNYSHGTGHGVGYFLNVHEGPQAISNKNKVSFEEGMIVSNEPGYYEKNKFGIRIENLLYVKKQNNKKYFEDFTLAPIEKDLIDKSMLDKNEERWLNNYHKKVFNNLKSFMNKQEIKDLKKACSTI